MSSPSATPRHRHVALCPFPFSSHPAAMLLFSRKIAATSPGVAISLLTTEPSASALSASLTDQDSAIKIRRIDSGVKAGEAVHPVEAIRRLMEVGVESLRKGIAEAEREVGAPVECVVADSIMAFACREIAEEMGVEWVAVWTSSSEPLAAHLFTDQLRKGVAHDGLEMHKEDLVERYISGFPSVVRVADLPHEILAVDYSFPVARILHLMSLNLPKAAAVAINSFHPLDLATTDILNSTFGDKFLNVGPYDRTMSPSAFPPQADDPHGCLSWLDNHASESVIYISFGSMHTPPSEEFTSLAEALEETRTPFLWSLPERFKPVLPEGFEGRSEESGLGKVVPWAPQTSVLAHTGVGAQLTHCGWNSVMESIGKGVPLLSRPLEVAEQELNGRLVTHAWGIGVEVEGRRMTKAAMVVALRRVMVGEEGKAAREKIRAMRKLVEVAAAEPDGSSVRNMRKFINIITRG